MKTSDFGQSASTSEELTDRNSDNLNGTTGGDATNFPVYLEDTGADAVVKWTGPGRRGYGSPVTGPFDSILPFRFSAIATREIFPVASETAPRIQP